LDGMAQDVVWVDRVEGLINDEEVELTVEVELETGVELEMELDDEDDTTGASQGSQDSRLLAT